MYLKLSLYSKIILIGGTVYLITSALSQEMRSRSSFKETLLQYIESNSQIQGNEISAEKGPVLSLPQEYDEPELSYREGDWDKYIIAPRYKILTDSLDSDKFKIEEKDDVDIISYGSAKLNLGYGKSIFTKSKYKLYDQDKPVSKIIKSGYTPENEMQLHMEGHVGERMVLYLDHDSRKTDNHYMMQYKAVRDEEVIREINAGEINIKMNKSKYAVYDDTSSKGMGIDTTIRKGNLQIKAFGSVTKGETVVETFRGSSSPGNISLAEYQYIKATYFQLEAFKRYDNLSSPPLAGPPDPYSTLITFTSNPSDPSNYTPFPVNIDTGNFELYMDDQNSLNNFNAIQLSIDNGFYTKLVSGSDYTINYTTGAIVLLKSIPAKSRIFAAYTLNNGSTVSSDPAAIVPGNAKHPGGTFSGRIVVFIKYGYSINEDTDKTFTYTAAKDINGDGKLNLDIYEIRSFYYIGSQQILQDNFKIQFLFSGQLMTKGEASRLGKYVVDYTKGIINFHTREPFKSLLSTRAAVIYNENQSASSFESSLYNIRIDYYRDARSFQLKHPNILPDSVRIRINNRDIPSSLYTVDYTSGFLIFTNPNNPTISSETAIEIKYEYLPLQAKSQAFVGGLRADYKLSRDLDLGGTMLYTRLSGGDTIPTLGSEPTQTMVFEGDLSLNLKEKRIKDFLNTLPGVSVDSVPFEISGYAEYARSYKNINTFGKALIDDFEATEETVKISLTDKDWILSSMPDGLANTFRGLLYYKYYRDPNHPDSLKRIDFNPYIIDYSKKPGPYNVADGHIPDETQTIDSQKSLVLDFDFKGVTHIPIATQRLSSQAVDFSGLQYVEIWYRAADLTGNVDLYLDIGKINEDADGDSVLETEDLNRNGILDTDPRAGYYEDRGYSFHDTLYPTIIGAGPGLNQTTLGDGVLNTEDLNGNGVLDTTESNVRLPGSITQSASPLTISPSDTGWTMKRIYIDRSGSSFSDNLNILKQVEAVRLFLTSPSGGSGKIYIDGLRFVSSRWRNDPPASTPDHLNITMIDTNNDSEYRANAFIYAQKDLYKSMHGEKADKDLLTEIETALQVEYSLTSSGKAAVMRKFSKPMDIRFYKTMNLWVNFRPASSVQKIGVRVGSSEYDYVEYEFTNDLEAVWREIRLNVKDHQAGGLDKTNTVGSPDFKRINITQLIVYSTGSGRFWVNDLYVSDPETTSDSAYWYEGEIKGKRPLFITKSGVPVISDLHIKYIDKGHGSQFSSVGQTVSDIKEKYHELFSSVKILPNWSTRLDFIAESSETDSYNENAVESRRGKSDKKSLLVESDFVSDSAVPSVKLVYKNDNYSNTRNERVSSSDYSYNITRHTVNHIQNPAIILKENLDNVLWGRLGASLALDTMFKSEDIDRNSGELSMESLEQYVSVSEKEKRQKGDAMFMLDYQSKYIYFQPSLNVASQEVVELRGKGSLSDTEILNSVSGNYHFPFIYNTDYRFVDRNKKLVFNSGLKNIFIASLLSRLEMNYYENRFRDYQTSERLVSDDFSRARDAKGFITNNITIPLDFHSIKPLAFIKNFTLSYNRTLFLQETDIPYEGEDISAFNEKYGINRAFNGLSGAGFNLFKNPPWHYFTGRNNYGNGRDYAYEKFNGNIYFSNGQASGTYNNSLRLIDNISFNSIYDFQKIALSLSSGLNQVSERSAINGVPQQVVVFSVSTNISFDLMQILHFGFFRTNTIGAPYHSASLILGYSFNRNMIISSNIEENSNSPNTGINFKWDRSGIGTKFGVDIRHRRKKEYIPYDESDRSRSDDIYVNNMLLLPGFKEVDTGYNFSIMYETDVKWLYNFFSSYYKLIAFPIFTIEYSLLFNRYDYTKTVSPEPYDQHLVTCKIVMDLHKNVQGGLLVKWALEKFRNRTTNDVYREIMSYEIGINFTLIF